MLDVARTSPFRSVSEWSKEVVRDWHVCLCTHSISLTRRLRAPAGFKHDCMLCAEVRTLPLRTFLPGETTSRVSPTWNAGAKPARGWLHLGPDLLAPIVIIIIFITITTILVWRQFVDSLSYH